MGINYIQLGYDNAKEEAEMEASLRAIIKADMAKPSTYVAPEITYVPWSIEIKELAKDVGKVIFTVAAVNFLGVSWFDGV